MVEVGKVIRLARVLDEAAMALPCILVASAVAELDSSPAMIVKIMPQRIACIGAWHKTKEVEGLMPLLYSGGGTL